MHLPFLVAFLLFLSLLAPSASGQSVLSMEGAFGRAEWDTAKPAMETLVLRTAEGTLDRKSLLSPQDSPWLRGAPEWGTQAYSYAVTEDGRRFESRSETAEVLERSAERMRLGGIYLTDASGARIAEEEWILAKNGQSLDWTVRRTWLQDVKVRLTGQPALFFTHRPDRPEENSVVDNSVTTTFWYDPLRVDGGFDPIYKWIHPQSIVSRHPLQVIAAEDTWAVFKLWTNWHHRSDLLLGNAGGRLYRRGMFGWVGEAGVQPELAEAYSREADAVDETTLRIGWKDKFATGIQLETDIPDSQVNQTLRSFYGSLFNGGTVNDQKTYDMGNESDGWYYAGSSAWQSFALLAGVPAKGRLAEHAITPKDALRRKLTHILRTLEEDGRTRFGYNVGAVYIDDNLNTLIAAYNYYLATGDRSFIRRHLDDFALMLDYFLERRNADGLFDFGGAGHWYYDVMPTSGVSTNHNTLLYASLVRMARFCHAMDQSGRARIYERMAESLREAINRVLWTPDAPGGPRYADWITPEGRRVTYAADIAQFPTIVYDVATPEMASQLIHTIDLRIKELERDYGYAGYASISAYWPVPDDLNPLEWQKPYTVYMNGGSFLGMTFHEIVARAKAGDIDGAWHRLKRFSQGAAAHSWVGNNWFDMQGRMIAGQDEPYLSDMVAVPAALIHGVLGVTFAPDDAPSASGQLPRGWSTASARVVAAGHEYELNWRGNRVTSEPTGRIIAAPALWEIDSDFDSYTLARDAVLKGNAHAGMAITLKAGPKTPVKRSNSARLTAQWGLDELAGNFNGISPAMPPLAVVGGAPGRGVPGVWDRENAVQLQGDARLETTPDERFAALPFDGLEALVRFRTNTPQTGVLISRNGAFCLYLKAGQLAGWVMNASGQPTEVVAQSKGTDGDWHLASLAYDPVNQSVSLYLNGKEVAGPLTVAQATAPDVPAQITVGGLGSSYLFQGEIAETAVFDAPLSAKQRTLALENGFETLQVESVPKPKPSVTVSEDVLSGSWQSPVCDWKVPFDPESLEVRSTPGDGSIDLVLEASDDSFATIKSAQRFKLTGGTESLPIAELPTAQQTRIRVELSGAPAPGGPRFNGFRLSGRERNLKNTHN